MWFQLSLASPPLQEGDWDGHEEICGIQTENRHIKGLETMAYTNK